MADFEVSANAQKVEGIVDQIADKELIRKIAYHAVMEGAWVLKRYAEEGFKKKLGEGATHPSPFIAGRPFYEGISVKGNKSDTVKVSILNDYRMKFFETGTEERYIKNRSHSDLSRGKKNKNTGKQNYRGRISKSEYGGWFEGARNEGRQEIAETVVRSIDNAMMKIANGEKL